MYRTVLKSKIHRAKVTEADLHYQGSITIDSALMEAADILPYEKVVVADVTNGARLETYAIEGEPGSGTICLNGAAAHLVKKDDIVIIISFIMLDKEGLNSHSPKVVFVDKENRVTHIESKALPKDDC